MDCTMDPMQPAHNKRRAQDAIPENNNALGEPESTENRVLETGAGMVQSFEPTKRLCAHLHAFHVYATDPNRISEANHYCAHVNDEVRQCLLYDSPEANARLIGVEYMISARLYETLDAEERKLWHSHVFEVKSGLLIMPAPAGMPDVLWERAENKEMAQVITLYGKVFQLWQVDRGDKLPLGKPELMMSFTSESQVDFDKLVSDRDRRFGINSREKAKKRAHIPEPVVHADADSVWKK